MKHNPYALRTVSSCVVIASSNLKLGTESKSNVCKHMKKRPKRRLKKP